MGGVIRRIVIPVAAAASIYGLYFSVTPITATRSTIHLIVLIFSVIFTAWYIIDDILRYLTEQPKHYDTKEKIVHYLEHWLKSGGRAVILSRDLSWANEPSTTKLLEEKAIRGELILLLSKNTDLSLALGKLGATIIEYGSSGFIPRSRFTIIDFEKAGARVAIGSQEGGRHVIREYQNGLHPSFAIAEDFARFIVALKKQKTQ